MDSRGRKSITEKLIESTEPQGHLVQLYGDDERPLEENVGRYLFEGLKHGDGLIAIATPTHRRAFIRELAGLGVDGQLLILDAEETLSRFMQGGQPDWSRFDFVVGAAVRRFCRRPNHAGLRAYGEMVGILWQRGQVEAAIQLEEFWNRLLRSHEVRLYCAYPIDIFGDEFQLASVDAVLCAHTHLMPTDPDDNLEDAINDAMDEVLGARAEGIKRLIKANFRPSWAELPRAEAIILWIRNNLPEYSEAILDLARVHHSSVAA
jgi:hypothetical protein